MKLDHDSIPAFILTLKCTDGNKQEINEYIEKTHEARKYMQMKTGWKMRWRDTTKTRRSQGCVDGWKEMREICKGGKNRRQREAKRARE